MLLEPDVENEVAFELCQLLGRSIVPVGAAGTAFFLRHQAGEYLVTAGGVARAEAGELGLRPSLTEPAGVAPQVVPLPREWAHPRGTGAAIMTTDSLHAYAAQRGWSWRVQPVPDAVALRMDEVDALGDGPMSAIVLALGVRPDGERPLEVAVERAVRADAGLRVTADLPAGYVGAPVFGVRPDAAGEVGLRCLGLLLPPDDQGGHPLATLDRILADLPKVD
ncbi:hypothetical protein ACFY3U_20970 [Micromonospora sp. NPDC000089]|uniref:hypothetical protein n=1 Tax=unclassified Micromonospora TaxID=2617518 RepID=UPI0036C10659